MTSLHSLPADYRALVVGASGGIGSAFVRALEADPRCARVHALSRRSSPPLDLEDDASIDAALAAMAASAPFHLIVHAAGVLHTDAFGPEKRLADLNTAQLERTFRVNALGPALVLARVASLVDAPRAIVAMISAKVGSIGDNRLGGWAGYRASKAALNMFVRTAAIELARTRPGAIVVAMHPGTVSTALSAPFGGATRGQAPDDAVARMLATLDALCATDTGSFIAYDGARLPW